MSAPDISMRVKVFVPSVADMVSVQAFSPFTGLTQPERLTRMSVPPSSGKYTGSPHVSTPEEYLSGSMPSRNGGLHGVT